jgi:ribonuclease D
VLAEDITVSAFDALLASGRVACDIETSGLDFRNDRIGTFQLHADGVGAFVVRVNGDVPIRLARLLADPQVCKVFHHALFDLRFVLAQWGVRAVNVRCTKVASKIVFPEAKAEAHSLKELLHRVEQIDISKDQQLTNWLRDDLTDEQIAYAAGDVVYLLPLLDALEALADSKLLGDLLERCFAHLPTRVELDVRGYPDVFVY